MLDEKYLAWKHQVNALFIEQCGCGWDVLCGEEDRLETAYFQNKDTPEDFVDWFVEKYDLIRIK